MSYDGSLKFDTKLDTSGLESGISKLKSAAKVGMAAVSSSLAAGIGLATKAGMDFEAQMSRVSAISGATGEDLAALTEKAKQMGIDTVFSATQAGEALQYMAQAGWGTEDMLSGLGGVMNLAAASGEDLGLVSDIVTDALTAFGLSAKDSAHFADVLAMASNASNTDVAKMGETFKYVAPVAGAMKFSIEDTAVAIGLMANAGIKGEQAGTTLRAVFTRLAKPPKEAADAISDLGLTITNQDGSFRSLAEIMEDLREKFSALTDEQKTQYAAMLGGQEAMSGLLSIVNAAPDDFEKLTEAISEADGSAEDMADTMLDNLQGQMTLMGSSLEGLGLAIYDGIEEPLKDAVKYGIEAINKLTGSFQSGELKGALASVGKLLGELVKTLTNIATAVIPPVISALAFVAENFKTIATGVATAVAAIKTFQLVHTGLGTITNIWKGITAALQAYTAACAVNQNVSVLLASTLSRSQLLVGVLTGQVKLATVAQMAWNAVKLADPTHLLIAAVAALAAGIGVLCVAMGNEKSESEKLREERLRQVDAVREEKQSYDELKQSKEEAAAAELTQVDYVQRLYEELRTLADENGRVEEAYRGRAAFILGELNHALGTEYQMVDGVIQKYGDLKTSINDVIQAKKAQILLETNEESYKEALEKVAEAEKAAADANLELNKQRAKMSETLVISGHQYVSEINKTKELEQAYNDASATLSEYKDDIVLYEEAAAAAVEGNTEKVIELLSSRNNEYRTAEEVTKECADNQEKQIEILGDQFAESVLVAEEAAKRYAKTGSERDLKELEAAKTHAENMKAEYLKVGGSIVDGSVQGIDGKKINLKTAVENLFNMVPQWARDILGIHSPSRVMREEVGAPIAEGVAVGIQKESHLAQEAMDGLVDGVLASEREYLEEKARIEEKRSRQDEEKRVREYQKRLESAKDAAEVEELKAQETLRLQKAADDAYLEELKATCDAEKEMLQDLKDEVKGIYSDIARYADDRIGSVLKAQEQMEQKLASFGGLTKTVTFRGAEEEVTYQTLRDMEADIAALQAYKDALLSVRQRMESAGFDSNLVDSFFSVMADMSVEEGASFAGLLSDVTDEEFLRYLTGWSNKQALSDQISKELYSNEIRASIDDTAQYMKDALEEVGLEVPEGFFVSGTLSAQRFGEAFVSELETQMQRIREMVSSLTISLAPVSVTAGAVPGAAGVSAFGGNTYNTTYQFAASGETVQQQIQATRASDEVRRMRGLS